MALISKLYGYYSTSVEFVKGVPSFQNLCYLNSKEVVVGYLFDVFTTMFVRRFDHKVINRTGQRENPFQGLHRSDPSLLTLPVQVG